MNKEENYIILNQIKRMLLSLVDNEMKEIIKNEDFKKYKMNLDIAEKEYERAIEISKGVSNDK